MHKQPVRAGGLSKSATKARIGKVIQRAVVRGGGGAAWRSARSSGNPRDRLLEVRSRGLSGDLADWGACAGPGGARAGPARSNGALARSATVLRAGVRAGVDVMDLAEAGNRPPHGARGVASCPNLPQRPGSSRNAGRESLIFRGFIRGRSRLGAPLWQIWTRPRPGSPQESHQHHSDDPRITFRGPQAVREAKTAPVARARSAAARTRLRPRRPADTRTRSRSSTEASMTVGSRFFCPRGEMPPTT